MSDDEESEGGGKLCVTCGELLDEPTKPPGIAEKCPGCDEPEIVNVFDVARVQQSWPRVTSMVLRHIADAGGSKAMATRYVAKARNGEPLYKRIVREAFLRRHNKQRLRRV